jgi:hypothetical protein
LNAIGLARLEHAPIGDETGRMATGLLLVVAVFLPSAFAAALLGTRALWRRAAERQRRPLPVGPPIERIAADLRRLNRERRVQVGRGPAPGRGVRSRALTAAYLDVLGVACRVLEVRPPEVGGGRTAAMEIARVEDELRRRGLDVEHHPTG